MDELYLLARTPIAMARACSLEDTLSSRIAAIEPFQNQFSWTLQALRQRQESNFDVEIVHDLRAQDCIIVSTDITIFLRASAAGRSIILIQDRRRTSGTQRRC